MFKNRHSEAPCSPSPVHLFPQRFSLAILISLIGLLGGLAFNFSPSVRAEKSVPSARESSSQPALRGQAAVAYLKQQGLYDPLRNAMGAARRPAMISSMLAEQAKLTADDGAGGDLYGATVSISGETVVVGSPLDEGPDDGILDNRGSAYVFVRSGASWSQQARLAASDAATNDQFGSSVAISGETIVVGAPGADIGANENQGAAYTFVRGGASWSQQAKLTAGDGEAGELFGLPVAISGGTVAVGVFSDNGSQGSAYTFVRSGVSWSQQAKFAAGDGVANDQFGASIAISGETVVVGAPLDDIGMNLDQGSAYVFVRSGVSWSQQAKLLAANGVIFDYFGISIAISGETAVVGSPRDDIGSNLDQGSAYVFVRSGAGWSQQAKLTAGDGEGFDIFGNSVAVSGDKVVVGAPNADVGAVENQGSAYVFVRNGVSWSAQSKLTASDGASEDQLSTSVAISGGTVVAGASLDDVGFQQDQGSAYIFTP